MREKFKPFIKFCATRTVPSTGTKSTGLRADTHGVMVFAIRSRKLHRDQTAIVHLSGLGTVKTIYHDPKFIVHLPGLAKKAVHRHERQLNRREVSIHAGSSLLDRLLIGRQIRND